MSKSRTAVTVCFSPPYWGSGFFRLLTTSIATADVRIITKKSFSVDTFIELMERYKVTSVSMPPSQFAMLLNSEKFLSSNTESLETFVTVGSILSKNLREKFQKIFPNKNLMIPYSMSEISISITKPGEFKTEFSVGSIIFPGIQLKIVDDGGNALDNGMAGEICAKPFFKFLVSLFLP